MVKRIFAALWTPATTPIHPLLFAVIASVVATVSLNEVFYVKLSQRVPDQLGLQVALLLVLWLLNLLLMLVTALPKIQKTMFLFFMLCGAAASYFMHTYGVLVDKAMLQNAVETDVAEAKGLLTTGMVLHIGILMALPAWLCHRFPIRQLSLGQGLKQYGAAVLLWFVGLGSVAATSYSDLVPFFRNFRDIKHLALPIAPVSAAIGLSSQLIAAKFPTPLSPYGTDATTTPHSGKPRLVVLVVGETARADHFSLNGYPRLTNPLLQQKPVVSFTNVSSCGTATAHSVPCMFSHMGRENYKEKVAKNTENLLDIVKRAGVDVTWLDNNSGCKGVCARVKQQELFLQSSPHCSNGQCHDTLLLEASRAYLQQLTPSGDKLLVLHQLGSHGPEYFRRSTPTQKHFVPECTDKQLQRCDQQHIVNAYDNSLVATDELLASLIDALAQQQDYATALLYLSDHGESLGENGVYLHGMPYFMAPAAQTHIPMIWWMSDDYAQSVDLKAQCLVQNRDKQLSHDNLFHTMLGVFAVNTSVYNAELDAFKSCRNGQ